MRLMARALVLALALVVALPAVAHEFTYRARVVSIYDGDTIRVDLVLGLGLVLEDLALRLRGIDAPELRGPEREAGIGSRDYLAALIPPGTMLEVRTQQDRVGKFGRLLAELVLDGEDLNRRMIDAGMAEPY